MYFFSTTAPASLQNSDGSSVQIDDSDIVQLAVSSVGEYTFSVYFDGSDVGLTKCREDIDAFTILDDENILISTTGNVRVPGLLAQHEDLLQFTPTTLGGNTSGSWSLYLDGNDVGLTSLNIDDFHVGQTTTDPNPNPDPVAYQLDVRFVDSNLTTSHRQVFQQAAARWSQIITADIPDGTFGGLFVDDLVVDASAPNIDGSGGILGQAGPTHFRSGSFLPARGIMQFDQADLDNLEQSDQLVDVILHAMGHVIGIGTIWSALNLVQDVGSNIHFVGATAVAEYNNIFNTNGNFVPVETNGGPGTAGGHWDEETFDNELMTGYLNGGQANPISRITIGALADMGYQVILNAADPYTPSLSVRSGDGKYSIGPTSNLSDTRLSMSGSEVFDRNTDFATNQRRGQQDWLPFFETTQFALHVNVSQPARSPWTDAETDNIDVSVRDVEEPAINLDGRLLPSGLDSVMTDIARYLDVM